MINYKISYTKPHRHFIDFQLAARVNGQKKMRFQLAAWRPGRYELGNFAQNIQKWEAFDSNHNRLKYRKITKDLWEVETANLEEIIINYNYYANSLDAGSCYVDKTQLYLNPIQCIFYIVDRIEEEYSIHIDIPNNYKIATSLNNDRNYFSAKDYHDLTESPIICSKSIKYDSYTVNEIKFHLWFQGQCKPNWKKLKKDFTLFTESQIKHFGSFPVDEYHFLFQITPYRSYHGVEHTKNTVILLGPGKDIMDNRYADLLGVCSHELYHTWNIKAIRPIEMYPYDYTKENYFRTGFVAEGVTTYMGDIMLYNSGVFNWKEFVKTQNQNLERHLMNYGRYNLSVADSGFDSWLDGYKMGIPNRKTSIYPDAALCMLMIDLQIIKNSKGNNSLHTVMKELYKNFALKNKGYNEIDFKNICIRLGGSIVTKIFEDHIYGTKDYIPSLKEAIKIVGLDLKEKYNPNITAKNFGFITSRENGKILIKKIEPNSVADNKGLGPDDEIIEVNGKSIENNIITMMKGNYKEVTFTIQKKFSKEIITLSSGNYYKLLEFEKKENISQEQLKYRNIWIS